MYLTPIPAKLRSIVLGHKRPGSRNNVCYRNYIHDKRMMDTMGVLMGINLTAAGDTSPPGSPPESPRPAKKPSPAPTKTEKPEKMEVDLTPTQIEVRVQDCIHRDA